MVNQSLKLTTHLTLLLLRTSEELIETLEENQAQLQNMMTSKYISYFFEEISTWQKRLSQVDQIISLWMDVQRTWSHLESIFIGSDDIRKQLPTDSERFDEIDTQFKALMVTMEKTPNVVEVKSRFLKKSLVNTELIISNTKLDSCSLL